jgi:Xaa-Pro aminopeptidase
LVARALDILLAYSVQGTISVPSNFPLTLADELRKEGIAVSVAREWCPERRVKKSDEADAMRAVARTTVRAFAEVERLLREATIKGNMLYLGDEALTSESVRQAVEIMLLKENAICSEGLVLSCGVHAAMPHESGSGPLRAHETVVADIFPRSRDSYYFSDMTRTYVKGEPSPEVARMYKAVKESHDRSLEALKPGVSGKEVYEMSAEVIRSVGFDVGEKGYVHSLGHGVGVSVHEAPLLSPRSNDVLEVGNVVTVEPGLYYPEYGGIRIEDTVLITEDGYEILTKYETPWVIE